MTNTSSMIAFQVGDAATGQAHMQEMIERPDIVHNAVSPGHHRSLIFWTETEGLMETSFRHRGASLESCRAFAADGILRLSAGLKEPDDRIADLAKMLWGASPEAYALFATNAASAGRRNAPRDPPQPISVRSARGLGPP